MSSSGSREARSEEWAGHGKGSPEYRRILVALLCAGIATFAQLYSSQGILPLVSASLHVSADRSALLISAATIGVAVGVLPWSLVADRFGRLSAMRVSIAAATLLGLAVVFCPSFGGIVALRFLEGVALGGLPALAVTYLQEEVQPGVAALATGTYVSGTTLGGLLGRVVAVPVADAFGWRWGVGSVIFLSVLAAVAFTVLAPAARGFRPRRRTREASVARIIARQLRTPAMLIIFAQAFLLMGGFVTVYNYLSFRLQSAPFSLSPTVTALLFFAYLAGTWSSRRAGSAAGRFGRRRVLLASIAVMVAGTLLTLAPSLVAILVGLVVLTVGFFGAHSIAAGWAAARADEGPAQAASLYNLFYYGGSSIVGWLGGLAFVAAGWPAIVVVVAGLAVVAGLLALMLRGVRPATTTNND